MLRTPSRTRRPESADTRSGPSHAQVRSRRTSRSRRSRPSPRLSLPRRLLVPVIVAAVGAGVALLSAGSAYAYWQFTDSSNHAAATAGVLAAPGGGAQNGTATPTAIPVSWIAPTGYTPTGYTVLRCEGSSCTPITPVPSGGCNGTVTVTSCTDNDTSLKPGTIYTYAVTGALDNWTSSASLPFQAATTGATKLGFTRQPDAGASIRATGTGTFDVSLAVEDGQGVTVANDNTDQVTLSIDHNPSHGVLSCLGGLTSTASAGVATFTGCSITNAGSNYTLTASSSASPALTAPSNAHSFNIIAGDASQLIFTTSSVSGPRSMTANLGPVSVQEQDVNGNPASAPAGGVAVGLSADSPSVIFAAAQGGSAVTSVTIPAAASTVNFYVGDSKAGSPVITVASTGLTSATQTEFAGAERLAILSQPVTGSASATATTGSVTVQLQTAAGVPVTTGITLGLSSSSKGVNEFSATSGGASTSSLVIAPGSSQATFYYGDELAGSPTLSVSASNVASASQTETISAGAAAALSFANASVGNANTTKYPAVKCTGSADGASSSCVLSSDVPGGKSRFMLAQVRLIDQFQNVVTNKSGTSIAISLSQTGGSSINSSSVSIPAGSTTSPSFTLALPDGTAQASVSASATLGSATVSATLDS